MLHKRAAQRADGSGWHYVLGKGEGGTPIGHCREHGPHPTEGEARECYSQFVRDSIHLDAGTGGWTSCAAPKCPDPARSFAAYGDDGYGVVWLCPDHMTIEQVIASVRLAEPAGDSWIS